MLDSVLVENRAGLATEQFHALREEVARHRTMERALSWFFAHMPPLAPQDLIPQDEFSFDLLVPFQDGLYLTYDTS